MTHSSRNLPKTPAGEDVDPTLYDPQLRWPMLRSRWVYKVRESFTAHVVRPLEERMFSHWLDQGALSSQIEAMGLPRRSVEDYLGGALELSVDPQKLVRSLSIRRSFPVSSERRKVSSLFLWNGGWDLTYSNFFTGYRYRFIQDIWQHRADLTRSGAYRQFLEQLEQGRPFCSHQKGILLNTPEKTLAYLQMYIGYMDDMARLGFDKARGKDRLGVAIDRNGAIVKLNRGLHRLAMAQVLGLDEVAVHVRAVHGQWWQQVTQGERGRQALARMTQALPACRPAP